MNTSTNNNNRPKFEDKAQCPVMDCPHAEDACAMYTGTPGTDGHTKVVWCALGHVSMVRVLPPQDTYTRLVGSFNDEEWCQ